MPVQKMTSRQRMLAALRREEVDHTPCSFMMFNTLLDRCATHREAIERQVAMGLDVYVDIPPRSRRPINDHYNLHGMPVSFDPRVTTREWIEHPSDEPCPIMIKEYGTPAGVLRAEVRQTDDWRWGDHVPFLDDFLVPRSRKFIVNDARDLDALRFLLVPPNPTDISSFRVEAEEGLSLARQHQLLTAGGWGVGADLIGWIHGLESMIFAAHDRPEWLAELLEIIAVWNRSRMAVVLGAGVNLYIKRAWYENLDFWSPRTWRKFIFPILRDDVALAHEHGALFGYLVTSNCMALLPMIAEAGVDALIGLDPRASDLATAKRELGGKVCLWGGVNGHLTVEEGTESEVRTAAQEAMRILAPGGGFILSPVDNVREPQDKSMHNAQVLIAEWQRLTGQPAGEVAGTNDAQWTREAGDA